MIDEGRAVHRLSYLSSIVVRPQKSGIELPFYPFEGSLGLEIGFVWLCFFLCLQSI